jgi:hypothetical protein
LVDLVGELNEMGGLRIIISRMRAIRLVLTELCGSMFHSIGLEAFRALLVSSWAIARVQGVSDIAESIGMTFPERQQLFAVAGARCFDGTRSRFVI